MQSWLLEAFGKMDILLWHTLEDQINKYDCSLTKRRLGLWIKIVW